MLKPILLITLTSIGTAAATAQAAAPSPSRVFASAGATPALIWAEEFDGTELDRDVWNVEYNGSGCGNHELEYYIDTPENVSVSDGELHITAVRRAYGDHAFTSGRLNTLGKFAFRYGVVEARVRLPRTADGLWPAVWFMGEDIREVGWPRCGEIDLLEMGHADGIATGTQDRLFNGAIHYGAGKHHQQVGAHTYAASLQDGEYHHFYLVWTPEVIEMYVDEQAEPYLSIVNAGEGADAPGTYFHKPGFVLLNLAVGGDFTGIHSAAGITALPVADDRATMDVDYIRIYSIDNTLIRDNTLISER